jgi:signal transduction histidine kinase
MNTAAEQDHERAQRLMAMGQMAASLAHEIRNPLGSMELFCTLLKKDLASQPRLLQAAEQIHHGIRTLDRIISNCLQFTRDVQPRKKRIEDPAALLGEILAYVHPKADELNVSLTLDCRGSGNVSADPYLLQQVLVNLLFNAVEAAAEAAAGTERQGRVELLSRVEETEWHVFVNDNGLGIHAEDLTKIFDPFFTTKQGGTGLGLTIVHSIVRAHGGTITLGHNSEAGAGTQVHISIPGESAAERNQQQADTADAQCGTGG